MLLILVELFSLGEWLGDFNLRDHLNYKCYNIIVKSMQIICGSKTYVARVPEWNMYMRCQNQPWSVSMALSIHHLKILDFWIYDYEAN